jgi:hypothetical protein
MPAHGSPSLPLTIIPEESPIIRFPGARIPLILKESLSNFTSKVYGHLKKYGRAQSSDFPELSRLGYRGSVSEAHPESLSRFFSHGRPIPSVALKQWSEAETQRITVTTTISVATTIEPDFGIGLGLYQVTAISAGMSESDLENLGTRSPRRSRHPDSYSKPTSLCIEITIRRFCSITRQLRV